MTQTDETTGGFGRRALLSAMLPVGVGGWLAAFGESFQNTLVWQQRDDLAAEQTNIRREDDRLLVDVAVSNPLDRQITVTGVEMVVYERGPPLPEDGELTVRRQEELLETVQIDPNAEGVVTVTAPTVSDQRRIRQAMTDQTAVASGLLHTQLLDQEFLVEVTPNE